MNGTGFMTEESDMAICNWKRIEYFHENVGTIWTPWFLWENNIWLTHFFVSNRNPKQVLRSTILSSTILLVFFDNSRMGRF